MPISPVQPKAETITTWSNPRNHPAVIDIVEGDDFRRPTRYTVPAKGTAQIPSRHDHRIRVVHNGAVMGGIAPFLEIDGEKDAPVLAEALDTMAAAKRQAEADLAAAELAKSSAEDAQLVAANKIAKATKK